MAVVLGAVLVAVVMDCSSFAIPSLLVVVIVVVVVGYHPKYIEYLENNQKQSIS